MKERERERGGVVEDSRMVWWNKLENDAGARGVEKCQELVFTVTTFTLPTLSLYLNHHTHTHTKCILHL